MTTLSFLILLLIAGFFSGDVGLYLGIWISLPIICCVLSEVFDLISRFRLKHVDKKRNIRRIKSWRLEKWRKKPLIEREYCVNYYKEKRMGEIIESLDNGVSEWRERYLRHELEIIDSLYTIDMPPQGWMPYK